MTFVSTYLSASCTTTHKVVVLYQVILLVDIGFVLLMLVLLIPLLLFLLDLVTYIK